MKKTFVLFALFVFTVLFAACAAKDGTPAKTDDTHAHTAQATAVLSPTEGNIVQGKVAFQQEAHGIRLIAEVSGLTPGSHGFHVHEKGDCSAPDASSAGGHFNPHGAAHGKPGEGHAGDLPALEADADGNARLNVLLTSLEITGEHGILGRGLIIHADPDDYVSQPTGNAGVRVACAVIQ
ncbi:MAG: superoxide dismutase family protein [Acidobacteria bacterium]|nr:superoxide dismutase family protein [Acidobacteriota bacterium]